jgi:hypothetical protein
MKSARLSTRFRKSGNVICKTIVICHARTSFLRDAGFTPTETWTTRFVNAARLLITDAIPRSSANFRIVLNPATIETRPLTEDGRFKRTERTGQIVPKRRLRW